MPLQASGQISFSNVATEIAVANSNLSMRSMSSDTGGTIPDAMSDFYGKSVTAPTWTVSEISTFTSNQSINAAYDMIALYARLDYASTLPITERGIVYSTTTSTPTIGNGTQIVLANNGGFQNFSIPFTYGVRKYVRSYATNRKGTTYGTGFLNEYAAYHNTTWSSVWGAGNYGTFTTLPVSGYPGCGEFHDGVFGTWTPTTAGTGLDGFNLYCNINGVSYAAGVSGNSLSFGPNIYNHGIQQCVYFSYQFVATHTQGGDVFSRNYIAFSDAQSTRIINCETGECP